MGIMEQFEPSRSNEKAFTHLEEALFWLQVMIANVPKKKEAPKEGELLTQNQ